MKLDFCVACGATKDLHHHHLVPLAAGGSDTDDNLITLCAEHHARIHGNEKEFATSELIKKRLAEKRERGEIVGNPRYGYKAENHIEVPCEKEQKVIDLARRLKETGMSYRKIAAHLTALGISNRKGNIRWDHKSIMSMLSNDSSS